MGETMRRQLSEHQSTVKNPDDFDEFWAEVLGQERRHGLDVVAERRPCRLETLDVFDVRFTGSGGQPIAAWLRIPRHSGRPLATVVEFDGYGRGRGRPEENLFWSSAGFAHLEMDTRGQSWSGWTSDTPDSVSAQPHMPGMLTKGLPSREDYYYRRVFTDAVRAFDSLPQLPGVDPDLAFAVGTSQGGGIALAAAALAENVRGAIVRVPFLSDIPQAVVDTNEHPYRELVDYLAIYRGREEQTMNTLAYFDGVNFARRARIPALFSVALRDVVCPPASVYGAYNAYAGEKSILQWRYNGHESGGIDDDLAALSRIDEWIQGSGR